MADHRCGDRDQYDLDHLLWMVEKLDYEAGLLIDAGFTQSGAHLKILAADARIIIQQRKEVS